MIHPSAIVEPGARLGAGCEIMAGAIVTRHCVLGDGVTVWPYAVLGGDPQDLKFDRATESAVHVGAGTVVREHVTVHRSTKPGGATVVGENCFLMAASHVGHDCVLGARVILANGVLLAGHCAVGDHAFLSGHAVFHQFVRVGEGAMVSGRAGIGLDLPPFVMAAERNEVIGLNLVGLRRRGVPRAAVAELKAAFRAVYGTPGNIREVAARALAGGAGAAFATPEARRFLEFFAGGTRGFARARRGGGDEPQAD
jgi:UDP-N-acetylglucosamine acyltransferase